MFSNNIKSFIILNIYALIIVNIGLLIAIYYEIIKDKIKRKMYEKALNDMEPRVLSYIENEDMFFEVAKSIKNYFLTNVVIDIMVNYCEENNTDISRKFINLKLDHILIKKIQKKASIIYLRKLVFMRVETAYDTFIKLSSSDDLDISYMSFFGLSLIRLAEDKTEIAIRKLVASSILSDRIIEILSRYNLEFEEWLDLLEKEKTIEGKVIFIKNIMIKEEIKNEKNTDRILKFLKDEKEVKIAAIIAVCESKNEKYIDEIIKVYENEENWEVRVAVAKGLRNFRMEHVKDILLKMTKDTEWWVRYNAVKSIVAMGEEGLFTLIDLSLGKEDKNISDLAYYFLNSNNDVYNTVKNIEV